MQRLTRLLQQLARSVEFHLSDACPICCIIKSGSIRSAAAVSAPVSCQQNMHRAAGGHGRHRAACLCRHCGERRHSRAAGLHCWGRREESHLDGAAVTGARRAGLALASRCGSCTNTCGSVSMLTSSSSGNVQWPHYSIMSRAQVNVDLQAMQVTVQLCWRRAWLSDSVRGSYQCHEVLVAWQLWSALRIPRCTGSHHDVRACSDGRGRLRPARAATFTVQLCKGEKIS